MVETIYCAPFILNPFSNAVGKKPLHTPLLEEHTAPAPPGEASTFSSAIDALEFASERGLFWLLVWRPRRAELEKKLDFPKSPGEKQETFILGS